MHCVEEIDRMREKSKEREGERQKPNSADGNLNHSESQRCVTETSVELNRVITSAKSWSRASMCFMEIYK